MITLETLSDHLSFHGISKKRACELFGRSNHTLERWENDPPKWVLNIIQLMGQKPAFPSCWNGWYFDDVYICDPAGNKYHINEVSTIFWTRQLTSTLTGDQTTVSSLKTHLERKIKLLNSEVKISLVNQGEELKSWNVSL